MEKTIRAIETEYNGYKFRSRLEARWAVFFDHMALKYEYEPEGFEIGDGLRYLPDFHLPGIRAWVEIKSVTPSAIELLKVQKFSEALKEEQLSIWSAARDQAQDHKGLRLYVELVSFAMSEWDQIRQTAFENADDRVMEVLTEIQDFLHEGGRLIGRLRDAVEDRSGYGRYNSDVFLCVGEPWRTDTSDAYALYDHRSPNNPALFMECLCCKAILIGPVNWKSEGSDYYYCQTCDNGACPNICRANQSNTFWFDRGTIQYDGAANDPYATPRLIAAYKAARQARFEFGATPTGSSSQIRWNPEQASFQVGDVVESKEFGLGSVTSERNAPEVLIIDFVGGRGRTPLTPSLGKLELIDRDEVSGLYAVQRHPWHTGDVVIDLLGGVATVIWLYGTKHGLVRYEDGRTALLNFDTRPMVSAKDATT